MFVSNPFSAGSWAQNDVDKVSSGWWVLLVTGIVSIIAGGIVVSADWTVGDLAVFIGALLVFRGVFTMVSIPIDGSMRGWSVGLGLVEVAVGTAAWVWPGPTLLVVAYLIGWYVLFAGIISIAGAISGRGVIPYWGVTLAAGIAEVALSFWLLGQPGLTLVAAVLAIGLWSLIYGVVQIVVAFEVKHMSSHGDAVLRDVGSGPSPRHLDAAVK